MIYFISRLYYKLILNLFFKFEIIGRENFPHKGPFIVVSNHVSYADPAVMGVSCNTVRVIFMAKQELFDKSLFGMWIKAVGCIPLSRHSGSSRPLKAALGKLKEGHVIGIFPEGTRSRDGKLQQAELGVGLLAIKSKAPIIPMYITGTQRALPVGAKGLTPCKIKAWVGKPVDITGSEDIKDKKETYKFVGKRIMDAIANLKK